MGVTDSTTVLRLDASHGEGGGQILRTALALAVALGRPVALEGVRRRRPKPGLRPQHLAVVRALGAIGDAEVDGDHLDSTAVSFRPRAIRGGTWRFDIGAETASAGSVPLLFQALLPALLRARETSRLTLVGGTHVPMSPTVSYLTDVFLPALAPLGVRASLTLVRRGWYPAGGGEVAAVVEPAGALGAFTAASPPAPLVVSGRSVVSRLPVSIAERQRRRAEERLAAAGLAARIAVEEDRTALGPGTVLFLACPGRAGFSALGRRGVPAERVADEAVDALLDWRASGAAVDLHLADQLMPLLALGGAPSSFTCPAISRHLETVAWVVEQFLPVAVRFGRARPASVEIGPRAAALPA